jgi:ATP adenylyltransferase
MDDESSDEVNMRHVRTADQRKLYEYIREAGICSFCVDFCQGKPPTYHPKPVLKETAWWSVTENMEPYAGAKLHLLLVYKQHVLGPPLPPEAWADLGSIVEWAAREYQLPGGGFYFRFGDGDYTGSSVAHFHANLIFGGEKDGERVRVKLGYSGQK